MPPGECKFGYRERESSSRPRILGALSKFESWGCSLLCFVSLFVRVDIFRSSVTFAVRVLVPCDVFFLAEVPVRVLVVVLM